jgi:hypothetical protein
MIVMGVTLHFVTPVTQGTMSLCSKSSSHSDIGDNMIDMKHTPGPWEFIELVARGNTEMLMLEKMADELIEQKAQLAQEFAIICTQYDGEPGGACRRCGFIAYEHTEYTLECQGCKFGLSTNHNLGLTCALSQGQAHAVANTHVILAASQILEALEALGVMPDGYCFCFGGHRDAMKLESEHMGECRDARAAIRKAKGE